MEKGSLRTPLGKVSTFSFGDGERSILLIAGIHGDEHNSIFILRRLVRLLDRIDKDRFEGRIIIIPIANPEAFKFRRRISLIDSLDLNRVFPGDSEGSATQRHAAALWGLAQSVDYLVDLHTCGPCVPYILTLYREYNLSELIYSLPIYFVVESSGLRGQLFLEALRYGVKSTIVELPQDGLKLDIPLIRDMSKKLLSFLVNLGFITDGGESRRFEHEFLGRIYRHHSSMTGVFRSSKKLGDFVNRGDHIGYVGSAPVKARVRGRIISLSPTRYLKHGEFIGGVAKKNGFY